MEITKAMFYKILTEAEQRAGDDGLPAEVRERSAETVELCKTRMAIEGWTRAELRNAKQLY